MAKSTGAWRDDVEVSRETFELTIAWDGDLAETGEIPAPELGAALMGWDRFLQLSVYSFQSASLQLPKAGTSMRVDVRVRRVDKGSFIVVAGLWFANQATNGIVGNAAYDGVKKIWAWTAELVKTHIKAKRERKTLDGVVEEIERAGRANGIRPSVDRQDTEDFAAALDSALYNATAPLDSSAASEVLALKGQAVEIVIDREGRQSIRLPFEPPTLDPDADDVIEAQVRFVRINKKTGYGILNFVRPTDASQLGQQRFNCEDRAIRRRANQYTGSFHEDTPLLVKMQRKNYSSDRHGHY